MRRKYRYLRRQESTLPQPCGEKDQFAAKILQPLLAAPHDNHGTSTSTREEPVCGGHVRGHSMSGRPPSDCRPRHVGRPGRGGALTASTSMSMLAAIPWACLRPGTGFHESVKQCKSLRCWEVKLSLREVPSPTPAAFTLFIPIIGFLKVQTHIYVLNCLCLNFQKSEMNDLYR